MDINQIFAFFLIIGFVGLVFSCILAFLFDIRYTYRQRLIRFISFFIGIIIVSIVSLLILEHMSMNTFTILLALCFVAAMLVGIITLLFSLSGWLMCEPKAWIPFKFFLLSCTFGFFLLLAGNEIRIRLDEAPVKSLRDVTVSYLFE